MRHCHHHLIVGGQRSGKSRQAERLALAWQRQGGEVAVLANRGGPDNPLSAGELATKFEENVARCFPGDLAPAVRDAVDGLAGSVGPAEVLTPLARPPA